MNTDPTQSFDASEVLDEAELEQPCLQIQVDLSAMLDGELDAASIRRVMVHSDVCTSCRDFLRGIRAQARMQRYLHEHGLVGDGGDRCVDPAAELLREQLLENRHQLARILYELGRAYVLMGVSPSFSRMVASEPVPPPDMQQRGRHLVAEMERQVDGQLAAEWVRARELFDGAELLDPEQSIAKGKRLLREAVMLDPEFHAARIYLGHAHHVCGERDDARRELRAVLETASDAIMRAFALENLGNVYLEEGRLAESLPYFHELVESGAIEREPRFFTTYFNLALAYGLLDRFEDCQRWFSRLYEDFPHRRRMTRSELALRKPLLAKLAARPEVARRFRSMFPDWFPISAEVA